MPIYQLGGLNDNWYLTFPLTTDGLTTLTLGRRIREITLTLQSITSPKVSDSRTLYIFNVTLTTGP